MIPNWVRLCLLLTAAFLFAAARSSSISAASRETWVEVRSPNFTVVSNAGEKEARKIADQFEQFREVFHNSFPELRVDLGKPLIIFAVKNEDSLKLLLPAYWEVKGRAHPAGYYVSGEDRHFVAVRTNIEGENPYEVVYHEYTHAIMNLNFQGLPVWLGEGLAEFYGNSTIHDKDVEIGRIAPAHLHALQQNRLIPIDVLLEANAQSPYYNEENRVSVFYAESWAIVHYLMMDPEARKRQLLSNFLTAWEASGSQVEAAQKTFGDLKKFSQAMEAYSRQNLFYVGKVNTSIHGDPKSYSSRIIPPADLLADRALFNIHTRRPHAAKAAVEEALQADPSLALAHEARGLLAYLQKDFTAAEAAFSRAIELNSTSYFVYYFDARARFWRGMPSSEDRDRVVASLDRAVSMNPQFAPAYAALSSVYSMQPETHEKAFEAGRKAMQLEPGNLSYAMNFVYVLLNAGKTAEAKQLVARIQNAARTPEDRASAMAAAEAANNREMYDKQLAENAERARRASEEQSVAKNAEDVSKTTTALGVNTTSTARTNSPAASATSPASKHANQTEYALEGTITAADCNSESGGKVTLTVRHVVFKFLYSSLNDLQVVSTSKEDSGEAPACSAWKGRRARLYFYQTKDKSYTGELETIQFF